jgi:L-threonylcarbamoyladenylate synthase
VIAGLNGRIAAVIDSGPCRVGLESTVLDLTGPAFLLRPGGVNVEALEAALREKVQRGVAMETAVQNRTLRSPGMLVSHYAPALPLRMNAAAVAADEALLAFGPPLAGAGAVFQLSAAGDTREAASRLFTGLRWLDAEGGRLGLRRIAAMPVPEDGLGAAIVDRLQRAAAPRG